MKHRPRHDGGRSAVLWLATAFVILQGAAVTAFIILAANDHPSWRNWAVWALLLGGIALGLWGLNRPLASLLHWQDLAFWLSTQDRTDPLETYRFQRRRSPPKAMGTNGPPTLESVREAAESGVRWVPHSVPSVRKNSEQDKRHR